MTDIIVISLLYIYYGYTEYKALKQEKKGLLFGLGGYILLTYVLHIMDILEVKLPNPTDLVTFLVESIT